MKNYLVDFLPEQGYTTEDSEYLLSIYDKIVADEKALAVWEDALSLYDESAECDYKEILKMADSVAYMLRFHPFTAELLMFITMSPRLKERYIERGIPLHIFSDTVKDLRYKTTKGKRTYGVVGFFSSGWFIGYFNLTRFCLGRLQFEIIELGTEYNKNGHSLTPETKVINVHIPGADTPFTPEACDEAFLQAKEFFGGEVADPTPFVCDSWFLFPEHETILPKTSNIYNFYKRYDVFEWTYDNKGSDLWRIFGTFERNIDRLPTTTSMQRAYIEYLKNGGIPGSGRGIFFL